MKFLCITDQVHISNQEPPALDTGLLNIAPCLQAKTILLNTEKT